MSTASDEVDAELVDRFRAALRRLNPEGDRLGLAVSGGPDSMAMLLLAHAAIPGAFAVATVNHGLRPEAAEECALVHAACAARGIACAVLPISVPIGNVQAQARQARYAALGEWARANGLAAIATAHHADDQAETFLMRLNRGSGVAGLAGVREARDCGADGLRLIRPLLDFRRAELGRVIAASAIVVATDPSNADPRYDRVRLRGALAQCDWLDPAAIARSATNLAEAYEALQDYAAILRDAHVRRDGDGFAFTPCSSREMNRRLVADIIGQFGNRPRGGDVARLLERLYRGEAANVGGVLASVRKGIWHFRPEPARRLP